jgi:RNA polymerase sigma-70 factor (ECF subfamily)
MARRGALPVEVASDQQFRTTFTRVRASVSRFGDSDDVVQEAYARAVRRRIPGDLEPWLRTVARRIAIDNARRRHELAAGDAIDVDRLRTPSVPTPEDVVIGNESVGLIRKAIRSLPTRYRDALVAYSEHRDNSAVADHLGVSTNAAGSLLCRARMRLREELDRVGYAAGAVLVKLQRVPDLAVTATAAVCFVAVIAGPTAAAPDGPRTSVTPDAVAAFEAFPTRAAAQNEPVAPQPARSRPAAAANSPLDDLTEQVEIVRYEVEACTKTGKRLPTPYITVIREGRKSVIGATVDSLPRLPRLTTNTCR